jgi:hypothetical protein
MLAAEIGGEAAPLAFHTLCKSYGKTLQNCNHPGLALKKNLASHTSNNTETGLVFRPLIASKKLYRVLCPVISVMTVLAVACGDFQDFCAAKPRSTTNACTAPLTQWGKHPKVT